MPPQGKLMWAHSEKVFSLGKELSLEMDQAGTFSDFQPSELKENKFLLFKWPSQSVDILLWQPEHTKTPSAQRFKQFIYLNDIGT